MLEKVTVITAGGSGKGAGAARRLAADGFHVAILSSSGEGEVLAKELGGFGVTGSDRSNDDLKRLVDQAVEKRGRNDVLVNSAGYGPRASLLELSDEDWHHWAWRSTFSNSFARRGWSLLSCSDRSRA